jgi:hypothetical protein
VRRTRKILSGLALAAAIFAYDSYEQANALMPVTGRVERIETLCTASAWRHSGYTRQKRRDIPEQSCDQVDYLVEAVTDYRDYRVFENTYVHYVYTTSIDAREHRGRQLVERQRGARRYHVGDRLQILVNGDKSQIAGPL